MLQGSAPDSTVGPSDVSGNQGQNWIEFCVLSLERDGLFQMVVSPVRSMCTLDIEEVNKWLQTLGSKTDEDLVHVAGTSSISAQKYRWTRDAGTSPKAINVKPAGKRVSWRLGCCRNPFLRCDPILKMRPYKKVLSALSRTLRGP